MVVQSGRAKITLAPLSYFLLAGILSACVGVVDPAQTQGFSDAGTGANKGTGGTHLPPPGTGGSAVLTSGSGGDSFGTGGSATGGSGTGGDATGGSSTGGDGTGGSGTGGANTGGSLGFGGFGGGGAGAQRGSQDGGIASDGSAAQSDSGAAATTWTEIYTTMLNSSAYTSNCTGSACHNPGTQKNIKLSTSALGYTSIRGIVTPGSPTAGTLIRVLTSGSMPQGRTKMATADLTKIKAWISAGALDN